ncbi:MAG: HAMP domain-containing histidine kinase [Candidatus Eisenbacteria bacterium]|nr:HAMP domain-containing histidine kinase [Candidatus Eisenbacteria bacterium]
MKLRTRLFLLFLVSGVVPLLLLTVAGWAPLRYQRGLWSLPSVESALEASLRSNRRLVDRSLRTLEDLGQVSASTMSWVSTDPETPRSNLSQLLGDPAVDFAGFLVPDPDGWEVRSATPPLPPEKLASFVPTPSASAEGPQRSRPLRWTDSAGDLLLVPTYVWSIQSAGTADDPVRTTPETIGCVLLGTRLGTDTFRDLDETSSSLFNYRRFGELGDLLAVAQVVILVFALTASLAVSALLARSVARRISSPVEDLVTALSVVGSERMGPPLLPTRIPEVSRIQDAFLLMRSRLAEYEERARESERVQASQETARFVAHEIRNALTPVTAGIAVLERRVESLPEESRPQGRRALDAIRREADRMASLAASFSEYAHLPPPSPEWIDLRDVIRRVAGETPPSVEVRVELPETAPRLFLDRDEVERLLRNLVKNATEAMDNAGEIDIRLNVEDRWATIDILDHGPGMDEKTLRQALQPGYTTKEGGSGLGLALVRRSMIRYGGKLEMQSELGNGTRVRLRFPLEASESERESDEA